MKTLQPAAPVRAPQSVRQPKAGLSALQLAADQSATASSLASLQRMANARAPVQRMEEEEMLQGKLVQRVEEEELQMKPIQRMEEDELQGKFIQRMNDEELMQGKAIQRVESAAPRTNNTGMSDSLKSGIESLSGMSMDHVKVHYNSDKPATVQAHAYAQGSDIHLGPGQEQHLPHEAWHVVQQAQGRVKPTMQLKGVAVNDDVGLEKEADVMGAKALQQQACDHIGAEGEQVVSKGSIVQRRAVQASEVSGAADIGEASIFDSRINSGKHFRAQAPVPSHKVTDVIKAYQSAITPIGNAFANMSYTDVGATKFPNLAPAFPNQVPAVGIIPYLMNNPPGLAGPVVDWFDVDGASAMERLFPESWSWAAVTYHLQDWFGAGRQGLRNNKYVGLIDPFIVTHVFQSAQSDQNDWEVDTQFADSAKGYIIRVHDGQSDVTGSIATAADFAATANTPTNDSSDLNYSSTHVPGGIANMGTRLNTLRAHQQGDDVDEQHDALDAFTLLAAEGARFAPVAELGAGASMTANFFTKPKKKNYKEAHSVTLPWLYINWGGRFGSAYNISKETMATVIDAQGVAITKKPAKPNYNLSTGTMDK